MMVIGGSSPRSATLAIDDQFIAKEYEKIVDELRRVRLDRALYLSNPPAPRHKGPESAPIAVAGGAPPPSPNNPLLRPMGWTLPRERHSRRASSSGAESWRSFAMQSRGPTDTRWS